MATARANDLRAFKGFIDEQLASEPVPTVHEVIARWNSQSDEERASTARAGRLADTEKVVAELREKFGLTSDALTLQSDPKEWAKRLQALVDSQPRRTGPSTMDDSRESIYAG